MDRVQRGRVISLAVIVSTAALGGLAPRATAVVPTTLELVSKSTAGAVANGFNAEMTTSLDGRYVVFRSDATNLVAGDTNARGDIFLRDMSSGTTELISVSSAEVQGSGGSLGSTLASVSEDGRYVAFSSDAINLVGDDTNARTDVFVRDRLNGTTDRVSVSSTESQGAGITGNAGGNQGRISADGRFVMFVSEATNFAASDTSNADVFVRDISAGTTTRVSVGTGGAQPNSNSQGGTISTDGRYIVFTSFASNLVAGDTNGAFAADTFMKDTTTGVTTLVSLRPDGSQIPSGGADLLPYVSDDGRYVLFGSANATIIPGDTNGTTDAFVRDVVTGATTLVSASTSGVPGNGSNNALLPSMTSDGRYVAFVSNSSDLVAGDTNGSADVFVRDLQQADTTRLSRTSAGAQLSVSSNNVTIAASGRFAVFHSNATNLVPETSVGGQLYRVGLTAVPGPPQSVTATPGATSLLVSWSPTIDTGGSPVVQYTATIDGVGSCTASPPATSCTIAGLPTGLAGNVTVVASNAVGTGPPSTAAPFGIPGAEIYLLVADPALAPLMAELAAAIPGLSIAPSDTVNGSFAVPTCPAPTSPLPAWAQDYIDMLAGGSYLTTGGTTAGPLAPECRPGAITVTQ